MFEIFNYPQVIAICLLSMFLLPLVFYMASKPGSKKTGYSSKHTKKKQKPLKTRSAKKGKAQSIAPAKKSKGKGSLPEKADAEAKSKPGKDEYLPDDYASNEGESRESRNQEETIEPRHED